MKQANKEVFYADEQIVKVGWQDIEFLKERVGDTERKRIRLCAHKGVDDKLQEMFIVLAKGTYIRPHKHLNKAESLHVIEGSADVVFFDEAGAITDTIRLGEYSSGHRFYYRVTEPVYHTLLVHSKVLVFHEATLGPFLRSDTVFAPWAPDESDVAATRAFTEQLEQTSADYIARRGGHHEGKT
jgi:cupin fold WbuC family metalloprotein